jgi:hypothetical protein
VTDSPQPQPFDERSALEELEQLADKIQRSRRQREQKVAEFDAFVRTFRQDRYVAAIAATDRERRADDRPAVVSAATHAARGVVPVMQAGAAPVTASVASPASVPESTPRGVAVPREPVAHAAVMDRQGRPRAAHVGVALAALAVIAVVVLLWRSAGAPVGPAAPSDAPGVPAASTAPAAPVVASPAGPAVPAPAATAGPPRAINIEIITIRPVWTRVIVDDRRVIYRLLAPDERIPLGADRAIAIRAGDAGALRLIVEGKDLGVLGRDGQVFQRVFTAR